MTPGPRPCFPYHPCLVSCLISLPQGARSLFTGLFEALSDMSDLSSPVVDVCEESKMVFLVWRCPASGFADATDTFVYSDNKKIYRQNVAFRTA